MSHKPLSIDDLRELIHKGEAKDPLVFLESVMNGQDPRRLSSIYELILEIDSFTGGDISQGEWAEIVDHVSARYKYHTVPISESMSAAKTLAEYIHAKRKQVEIKGDGGAGGNAADAPLTEEEIELFKEKFNDDF
jgi:hypothetical protein